MRLAKWLGCAAWAGSWYLMYLEVTRWRHVKPSLAFNSDPIPGTDIRPKPGLPLILVYITCAAAPLTVITVLIRERLIGRLPARGTTAWPDKNLAGQAAAVHHGNKPSRQQGMM
jgi:hypothetical protein